MKGLSAQPGSSSDMSGLSGEWSIAVGLALIPWRVKSLFSRRFPLATHYLLNLFEDRKDPSYWDRGLEADWDTIHCAWPTKNALISREVDRDAAILDVGCGTGDLLRHLHANGYTRLHGFDHSSYAVKRLGQEGIEMTRGSLPDIALPDCSFDVVVASQVLEHIINRKRFAREVHRVLRPGGRFFCFVPNNCLDPLAEPSHVQIYNRSSLEKFLGRTFDIQRVETLVDENHPNYSILYAVCAK